MTSDIITSMVSNNSVPTDQLPSLIASVHATLASLGQTPAEQPEAEKPIGAVSARKSLADPNVLISMIDGKPYSSLKRHVTGHGYTPQSYREAFGLKPDYPMVAPGYSERRRDIAKKLGLGRKAGSSSAQEPTGAEAAPAKKARKARKAETVTQDDAGE